VRYINSSTAGVRIDGYLLPGRAGHLFRDQDGLKWWILVAPVPSSGLGDPGTQIIACSEPADGSASEVRVLAVRVGHEEAEGAFAASPPGSFEEAVSLARSLGEEQEASPPMSGSGSSPTSPLSK
jgi:hypothetical protein